MQNEPMKELEIITDPELIREISNDPNFDRDFNQPTFADNRSRIEKMLEIFSFNGRRFPTMCPRTDAERTKAQDQLWSKFDGIAKEIKSGPAELEPLAEWVRGTGAAEDIGPLVQQSVGRLFVEDFVATKESWDAACTILEASVSSFNLTMFYWRMSGKLDRAKALLSSMVNGDLSAVNGIGVALHHIVDGLHRMRELAADPKEERAIDAVVGECLFAPGSVVRLAKADGTVGGCPLQKRSLFVLKLVDATQSGANRDLVFLSESWSRCPADTWVIALLEGVWRRVQL
jgi:hypothetical protein